jgi:hypothetical protein
MMTIPQLHPAIQGYPKRWHLTTLPDGSVVRVVEEFTITGISLVPHGLVLDCTPAGANMLAECIRPSTFEDVAREVAEESC